MITALHQVFGRKYGEIASIPFSNTKIITQFPFSTRSGNCVINWGDGSSGSFTPSKNIDVINTLPTSIDHTYSTAYTGNVDITFNNGLSDVYSLFLQIPQSFTPETNTFNIQDFNAFINQFSNLYSLRISSFAVFASIQKCNIKGNVADVPNSVERIELGHMGALVNPNDLYLDVSNFKVGSQLKWLNRNMGSAGGGLVTTWQTYGNLAKLPSQLYYFKLAGNTGTFTYSGTKVWASSFDTLDIGNASLSATETDNLFNDMANSITTAIGSKIIILANCYRTSASNTAVAYLQSLGFTITVAGIGAKILEADATTYTSGTVWNDTSGNANHITLQTAYAKDATYGGNIKFTNGSAEATFAPIDSKYFTLIFWIKMDVLTNYNQGIMLGQSTDVSIYWGGSFLHHSSSTGYIYAGTDVATANRFELNSIYNNTTPKMVAFTFANRTLKLYINGSLFATKTVINPTKPNFSKLLLGSGLPINAKLGRVLLYNYPLNGSEISTEFNNNKTRFGL